MKEIYAEANGVSVAYAKRLEQANVGLSEDEQNEIRRHLLAIYDKQS